MKGKVTTFIWRKSIKLLGYDFSFGKIGTTYESVEKYEEAVGDK